MTISRFKAKIVPKVLKCKTFSGIPTNAEQKYEVCEKDVEAFIPQLKSGRVPFCYNHDEKDVVGRVVDASRNPADNALEIEYEVDASTEKGKEIKSWMDKGLMHDVSLSHLWGSNQVLEVSACWIPARTGSKTYADVTDPQNVKLLRQLHFNTNSGRYERDADPMNPIRVAASFGEDQEPVLLIYPVSEMTSLAVNASSIPAPAPAAAAVVTRPPAAVASPPPAAAAAAAATVAPTSPPPPPAASTTEPTPMDVDGQTPLSVSQAFEFAKNKFMHNNGPWKKEDRQAVLESMANDALLRDKALKEAADAKAELERMKAEKEEFKQQLEAEVRKKQDALNDGMRQKVADALEGLDHDLPMKARIQACIGTATKEQLEAFDVDIKSVLQVQASRPLEFKIAAEKRYRDFHAQHLQQQRAAPAAAAVASAHTPSPSFPPIPVAASASASGEERVSASYYAGYDSNAPRKQPRDVLANPVRASASRRAAAMRRPGAVSEHANAESHAQTTEWKRGAGANFFHAKVTAGMKPETKEAYEAVWDHAMADDGTGGDLMIRASDYQNLGLVVEYGKSSRMQPQMMRMNQFDDDYKPVLED